MPILEAGYSLKIPELIGLEDYRNGWEAWRNEETARVERTSKFHPHVQEYVRMTLRQIEGIYRPIDAVYTALLNSGSARIWPQNVDIWTTSMTGNEFKKLMDGIGENFWKDKYSIYDSFLRGYTVIFTSEWTRASAGISSFRELQSAQGEQPAASSTLTL